MANEPQNGNAPPGDAKRTLFQRLAYRVQVLHYAMVHMRFILTVLAIALVEALLAPLWPRLAILSLATAGVAAALILANFSLMVSEVSLRLEQIYRGVLGLRDEELSKLVAQQRRAAPEPPRQSRPN